MKLPFVAMALVAVGWACSSGATTPSASATDHSAFFNGAGYQGDIPVRTGPTSRVVIRTNDRHHRHPNYCPPRFGYSYNYWVAPVRSHWVPGHYEWRTQRVWVEASWTTEYVPPVYEYGYEGSRQVRRVVQEGYYRRVRVPGYYEDRPVQVWVEGYWQYY